MGGLYFRITKAGNKTKFILMISFLILILIITFLIVQNSKHQILQSEAKDTSLLIENTNLTINDYLNTDVNINFSLFKNSGIFDSKYSSQLAANEFLKKDIFFGDKILLDKTTVFSLEKKRSEKDDGFLKKIGRNSEKTHFFYQQYTQNVPIIGANLTLHFNKNKLYSLQGNILKNTLIEPKNIRINEINLLINNYLKEKYKQLPVQIIKIEDWILNEKILGISNNNKSYPVKLFTISLPNSTINYQKTFFFNLNTLKVNDKKEEIIYAFTQAVSAVPEIDFQLLTDNFWETINSPPPQMITRINSETPIQPSRLITANTAHQVNTTYDSISELYDFFQEKLSIKSYDNKDGAMVVAIYQSFDLPYISNGFTFAFDNPYIFISDNLLNKNIIAHEFAHKLSLNTWQSKIFMSYAPQTGTIAEAISDIISTNFAENWQQNLQFEDKERYLNNPTKNKYPDKLFSPYTSILGADASHINSTIIGHAFYLMTEGGKFNSCQIEPLGRDIPLGVLYQAMKYYLPPYANLKDFYNSMISSCIDLYKTENSRECSSVISALQSVELDQALNSQWLPQQQFKEALPSTCSK